jgi:uncharacterized RDD family membrane protein YckC
MHISNYPPPHNAGPSASYAPVYVQAPQVRYANFIVRFFAAVIDDAIVGALVVAVVLLIGVLGSLFGIVAGGGGTGSGGMGAFLAMFFFAWPFAGFAFVFYFVKLETGPQQATIGKRVMGLKVVNPDGSRISIGQSLGRLLVKWLFSDLFFMIGYIMAAFTEKRQALHDYAAGTLVIESR